MKPTILACVALAVVPCLAFGCDDDKPEVVRPATTDAGGSGGTASGGSAGTAGAGGEAGAAGAGPQGPVVLLGAPMVFAPTLDSFGLSVVLAGGEPSSVRASVRAEGDGWQELGEPDTPTFDVAEWIAGDLEAGTSYEYQIWVAKASQRLVLYEGSAVTQRSAGEEFSFALVTDTHVPPREWPVTFTEDTLSAVARDMRAANPDFIVNLGDMLDFHCCGFNAPPPSGAHTRSAYLNYRRLMGDSLGHAAHFPVIGNWDGENGDFSEEQIAYSREQRLLYAPAPEPNTYPEGGNADEDYYAFTWGDALFVVLNVMTYTPTPHLLSEYPGVADDWTLGEEQMEFLEDTLENATSQWRFLLIHHAVGGAAGDSTNAAYGRGGGQAANVGEQAVVHALMQEHGVQIFFYGHDHVFTDMVVDGIHYTLPGSAGAPWKFEGYETGYTEYWPDSGYGRVSVGPEQVRVDFIAQGGGELYSYTLDAD